MKVDLGVRAIVLVVSMLLLGLMPESRPYVEAIVHGNELRRATEYRAALRAYDTARSVHPKAALIYLLTAQSYLDLGKPEKALPLYRKALAESPGELAILVGWGQAYSDLGDTDRAIELWKQALRLNRHRSDAYCLLGMAYLSRGDLTVAATNLEASLNTASEQPSDSQHQMASYGLGLLRALDDLAVARKYLDEAVRGPDAVVSSNAQAIIQALAQATGESRSRKTILGAALVGLGQWQLAQAHLERAIADNPHDVEALAYLGEALSQQGKSTEAEARLRAALALDPDHILALYFWGKHNARQGLSTAAREAFERILALDNANAAACAEIGRTYVLDHDYALAQTWFEEAVTRLPDLAEFYLVLAEFESEQLFDVAKGLSAARKAAEIDPQNPLAQDMLGWLF